MLHCFLKNQMVFTYKDFEPFFTEDVAEEPVIRQRKASAALDMDDFEMISEEELAEVSP